MVGEGDVIAMSAVEGLRFTPAAASEAAESGFRFQPVFADGSQGEETGVELHLLKEANGAPVAENLELTTYKNVAVTDRFSAVDPEGDLLTYRLVKKPARGSVTIGEDGQFVYTPYENKTGKDSFTYIAMDTVGNASDPATVKVKIEKPDTKVTYADLDGHPAHKAAIRLAEEGVFVGECMGGAYFFQPDAAITRSEFVAMAMNAAGVDTLEGVTRTGFADDDRIPTWAKPYVSSALKCGLVQGTTDEEGKVVFRGPVGGQPVHLRGAAGGRRPHRDSDPWGGGGAAVRRPGPDGQPGHGLVLKRKRPLKSGRFPFIPVGGRNTT